MAWLGRTLGLAGALALALFIVACDEPVPLGEGDAGSGGGGTGGTGGQIAEPPDCDGPCPPGEECNRSKSPPRCECTHDPDSCAPFGGSYYCASSDTCESMPPPPFPCDVEGEADEWGFCCVGGYWWECPRCSTSDECEKFRFCDKRTFGESGGRGYCWYNYCGDGSVRDDGRSKNGANWESCDPDDSFPENASAGAGHCVPLDHVNEPGFLCLRTGPAPAGGRCRPAASVANGGCAPHTACFAPELRTAACETDEDCGSANVVCDDGACIPVSCTGDEDCNSDAFCDPDTSTCAPYGTCLPVCNAGTGDAPACTEEELVCLGAMTKHPEFTDALGVCTTPGCNVLGGSDECPPVGGQPGMCFYGPAAKNHPFLGECGVRPWELVSKGQSCDGTVPCEQGSICVGSREEGYFCRGFCECPDADWDPSKEDSCTIAAPQCDEGEACTYFGRAPTLGACLPAD